MRLRPVLRSLIPLLLGLALVVAPALAAAPGAVTGVAVRPTPAEPAAPATPPGPTPSPTPRPTPTPTPRPPQIPVPLPHATPTPVASALQERLSARLAVTPLGPDARVGVVVLDAAGATVFSSAADDALLPASTQKLFVAAAALHRLGPDFRFRTEVAGTGPIADGVLHGDLVILGGIDPALATPTFAEQVDSRRPRTPLESLAEQVVAAGVTAVTGRVLGDASVLPHEPEAPGWLPRYLSAGNSTRSSGLTVDGGRRLFVRDGRWHSDPSPDPASEAAAALASQLDERGVAVAGGTAAIRTRPATEPVLATVHSPELLELLRFTVQHSDNHLADAIFRALGRADGDGSWTSAAAATRQALSPLGLDLAGASFADGSGLSREGRVTARQLAELDQGMSSSALGPQWRSLMAVSGESGTLRRRLVGGVAERRLLGKTGSLRDVRTLSGAVEGPEGARYHFAVLGNRLDAAGTQAVRALQDDVVLALAEDLYGCELLPVEEPLAEPPEEGTEPEVELELVCAG